MSDEPMTPEEINRRANLLLASAAERAGDLDAAAVHKSAALMGAPVAPNDKPAPKPPPVGPTGAPVPAPYAPPATTRNMTRDKIREHVTNAERAGDWESSLKLKAQLLAKSRRRRR